jgi:hypothetical protein
MLCKDLAMHEPDRWYGRDLSGNALGQTGGRVETCQAMHWTRQVAEQRPVRQRMDQIGGRVETCQAMHGPDR